MTNHSNADVESQHHTLAVASDHPINPLAEATTVLAEMDDDPFAIYTDEVLEAQELAASPDRHFEMVFEEWRALTHGEGGHPTCPRQTT